jgi:putative glycosyltransferase (TIGR04372 family)
MSENYKVSKKEALNIVNDFNSTYYEYEGNGPLASLFYLEQHKFLIDFNFPSKLKNFSDKFLHRAFNFDALQNGKDIKLCTLILRKSWKPWSGLGIVSYYEAIEFLSKKGYIINVVGDIDEVSQARSAKGFSNIYFYRDYNLNSKIFQLLSIFHSNFCFGDQSGTQTLVHLFGKENLILNSVPFGQLRYNTITLPRVWERSDGKKVGINEYYSSLLYRFHDIELNDGRQILSVYHSPQVIFEAVKHFVESLESKTLMFDLQLNSTMKSNSMFLFAKKSSYSPIFFKNI